MKMFVGTLKKKKDAGEAEKKMAEMISSSYDISDISYTGKIPLRNILLVTQRHVVRCMAKGGESYVKIHDGRACHTPTTRKLTCTACGHKGFCVEVWGGDDK